MSVPRRVAATCHFCKRACLQEVYWFGHRFLEEEGQESVMEFCSMACVRDWFEVKEKIMDQVEARVTKEKMVLYERICPSCRDRFHELE